MVACGFAMLLIFALAFYFNATRRLESKRRFLKLVTWSLPLPWIAAETGWVVAEYGRQPWSIGEILPTHLSTSTLEASSLYTSIGAIVAFYTLLLVIEVFLMVKYARLGPSALHTGRYHFEKNDDHHTTDKPEIAGGAA